jgi:hypothetical protein
MQVSAALRQAAGTNALPLSPELGIAVAWERRSLPCMAAALRLGILRDSVRPSTGHALRRLPLVCRDASTRE